MIAGIRRVSFIEWLAIFIIIAASIYLIYTNQEYFVNFGNKYNKYFFWIFLGNVLFYHIYLKNYTMKVLWLITQGKIRKFFSFVVSILILGRPGTRKTVTAVVCTQVIEGAKIEEMHMQISTLQLLLSKSIDLSNYETYVRAIFDVDVSKDTVGPGVVYTQKKYKELAGKYMSLYHVRAERSQIIHLEAYKKDTALNYLAYYAELLYYVEYRKIHVQSVTTITSINTGYNNLPLFEPQHQMFRKNKYASEKFLTKVEDEKAFTDNSRRRSSRTAANESKFNDGKDVHEMIQRHEGKDTNTRISVAQMGNDVVAYARRMYTYTMELLAPKDIFVWSFEISILEWLFSKVVNGESSKQEKGLKKAEKLLRRSTRTQKESTFYTAQDLYNKYSNYHLKYNNYKKIGIHLFKAITFLKKYQYTIMHTVLHSDSDNVGKTNYERGLSHQSFYLTLVYPVEIVYGRFDTHALYEFFEIRNEHATVPLSKVKPFRKHIMTEEGLRRLDYDQFNECFSVLDDIGDEIKKVQTRKKIRKNQLKKESIKNSDKKDDQDLLPDYSGFD